MTMVAGIVLPPVSRPNDCLCTDVVFLTVELLPQSIELPLQRDHLLAEMKHGRGTSQIDAQIFDKAPYPESVVDVRFGVEALTTRTDRLEQSPFLVAPKRALADTAASGYHRYRVARLIMWAVFNHPIGHRYLEGIGFPLPGHQDRFSGRSWRSSSNSSRSRSERFVGVTMRARAMRSPRSALPPLSFGMPIPRSRKLLPL